MLLVGDYHIGALGWSGLQWRRQMWMEPLKVAGVTESKLWGTARLLAEDGYFEVDLQTGALRGGVARELG